MTRAPTFEAERRAVWSQTGSEVRHDLEQGGGRLPGQRKVAARDFYETVVERHRRPCTT
jgi:hypothetical protein